MSTEQHVYKLAQSISTVADIKSVRDKAAAAGINLSGLALGNGTIKERRERLVRRISAAIGNDFERDAWVSEIIDPAQRALARALPDLCAIFGVVPSELIGRPAAETPAGIARGSVRQLALGAVATLGRAIGITWNGMHARNPAAQVDAKKVSESEKVRLKNALRPGNMGSTEVRELRDAHRASLANSAAQFSALIGLDGSTPQGEIGELARVRYQQILRTALAEVRAAGGDVVARTGDDD